MCTDLETRMNMQTVGDIGFSLPIVNAAHKELATWVMETATHCNADSIQWCDGSGNEAARIDEQLIREGQTFRLNEKSHPNCLLHRSDPTDVARTEKITFICTQNREEAGPTNNWMPPAELARYLIVSCGSRLASTSCVLRWPECDL